MTHKKHFLHLLATQQESREEEQTHDQRGYQGPSAKEVEALTPKAEAWDALGDAEG